MALYGGGPTWEVTGAGGAVTGADGAVAGAGGVVTGAAVVGVMAVGEDVR